MALLLPLRCPRPARQAPSPHKPHLAHHVLLATKACTLPFPCLHHVTLWIMNPLSYLSTHATCPLLCLPCVLVSLMCRCLHLDGQALVQGPLHEVVPHVGQVGLGQLTSITDTPTTSSRSESDIPCQRPVRWGRTRESGRSKASRVAYAMT